MITDTESVITTPRKSEVRDGNLLQKIQEARYQQQLLAQGRNLINTISETEYSSLKPEFQLALSNIERFRDTKEHLLINFAGIIGETRYTDADKGSYIAQKQEQIEKHMTTLGLHLEALRTFGISPQVIDKLIDWPNVRSLTNPQDTNFLKTRLTEIHQMIVDAYDKAKDKTKSPQVNETNSSAFIDIMGLFDTVDKIELANDNDTQVGILKKELINNHNILNERAFKNDQNAD